MLAEDRSRSAYIDESYYWIETCASTTLAFARSAHIVPMFFREREGVNKMNNPRFLLALGLFLMLLGIILPFMMVIHVIKSTFFINFFAYGCSVTGLVLGTIGFAQLRRTR